MRDRNPHRTGETPSGLLFYTGLMTAMVGFGLFFDSAAADRVRPDPPAIPTIATQGAAATQVSSNIPAPQRKERTSE